MDIDFDGEQIGIVLCELQDVHVILHIYALIYIISTHYYFSSVSTFAASSITVPTSFARSEFLGRS